MTLWRWLFRREDDAEVLNIPAALFRKWMQEVAAERKERA